MVRSNQVYKRQTRLPIVGDTKYINKVRSVEQCALHAEPNYMSFVYSDVEQSCKLMMCANPEVVDDKAMVDNSIDIYVLNAPKLNKMLARGECILAIAGVCLAMVSTIFFAGVCCSKLLSFNGNIAAETMTQSCRIEKSIEQLQYLVVIIPASHFIGSDVVSVLNSFFRAGFESLFVLR